MKLETCTKYCRTTFHTRDCHNSPYNRSCNNRDNRKGEFGYYCISFIKLGTNSSNLRVNLVCRYLVLYHSPKFRVYHLRHLYFFVVNKERNGLVLQGNLSDKIADSYDESLQAR